MTLSISQWHQRYQQQAEWTQNIRNYIYERIALHSVKKILDIGCGTGVLEKELNDMTSSHVSGVDIDIHPIRIAEDYAPNSTYIVGDGLHLPYPSGTFDVTLCHFLLLWVANPLKSVKEMARVTRSNGFVLALAEPDYGGRIDYPTELAILGSWQIEALKKQGANPLIGRELRSLFSEAALSNIEVGILGGQWGEDNTDQDFELEWQVIRSDLFLNSDFIQQAETIKELEAKWRSNHQRILYVPTFYAIGTVR
jgi:ubiquinone/menaquinone biosynthesis C-methylase UbiE